MPIARRGLCLPVGTITVNHFAVENGHTDNGVQHFLGGKAEDVVGEDDYVSKHAGLEASLDLLIERGIRGVTRVGVDDFRQRQLLLGKPTAGRSVRRESSG